MDASTRLYFQKLLSNPLIPAQRPAVSTTPLPVAAPVPAPTLPAPAPQPSARQRRQQSKAKHHAELTESLGTPDLNGVIRYYRGKPFRFENGKWRKAKPVTITKDQNC